MSEVVTLSIRDSVPPRFRSRVRLWLPVLLRFFFRPSEMARRSIVAVVVLPFLSPVGELGEETTDDVLLLQHDVGDAKGELPGDVLNAKMGDLGDRTEEQPLAEREGHDDEEESLWLRAAFSANISSRVLPDRPRVLRLGTTEGEKVVSSRTSLQPETNVDNTNTQTRQNDPSFY